ncbi:probable disease resistance protein At4g27220 isoform X1 [Gossypium raimondii]|uniref:probable disease resistance protein At4g27220 isoform X1 n=1 Tax=Gossypium raimondii TaxID=29730 RepID=UPI00227A900E|nr:probable disease resistance protein At4g27220 isoform X1 [Gossypium raimondii]
MKRVNKILVIVHDLWEEFKMESIGIPFGDEHEGCKILLITRRPQVCTKMNCKEIQLGILSEDEAWVLFRDKARLEDDCSTLNDVAKEVAAQCKGLPLAIVVVANALKGESLKGWRDANQRFKDSTHLYDEEVLGGVLEPLKLSYDYLKKGINQMTGNHIQMCFLLCSLFPEDEEILIEILIMCGIGVGLFPNFSSIEDKRKKIVEALKKVQKSGLLLETDGADTIRIHDVIRDFAHWLTSTGENRFMVKDTLEKWPHMDESYTAIALWNCSSIITKFPDKVEFSKLKILFLEGGRKRNRAFLVVFGTFFEEMKALQVLLLQCVSFPLKGFPSLPNLKTLWCHNCMLKNFSSSLTNMRSLEILALIGTEIDEISEELVKLSALQYIRLNLLRRIPKYFNYSPTHDEGIIFPPGLDLGLSGVEFEEEMNIPPNLVSRLTSLQELHVIHKNNLNLLELKSLPCLTALSLRLSTNQIPLEDFVLPKLQRYAIAVGEDYRINREAFRRLDIQDFSSSLSAFNNLFCNVEELNLRNVGGQKNIVPSIDEMGVNELTSLQLKSCNDMEFLIDTKKDQGSTVAFSNLVELNIESMASLKGLCYGLSPTRFLQNLKEVIINGCEELQVIFQIDKPLMLSNLTELSLHSLPKLKRIWEVKPSHRAIASLQSLKVVRIEYCDNLKTIFSPCLALSMWHLQELYIRYCDRVEQVIGFGEEDEIIENDCLLYCWPKLEVLCIKDCESLKYISTNTLIQSLKCVYIENCHQLIQIYNTEQDIVLPELGSLNHCWTKLKTLWVVDCQLLKYVFANTLSHRFPLLESLYLKNCPQLLQVFSSREGRDVIGDHVLLNVPFLKNLEVSNCPQISCFIVQAQLIEKLVLRNVGNSRQLCNTDVPILNEGCIVVGNHKEVFQVQGRYSFSSIEKLELMNLLEVRVIWNDFAQVVTLENLTTLTLRDCKKLGYIFSPMMARSLSHLVDHFILGCEEIKRLILAKDQVSSSSSNGDTSLQPMSFPNLTRIVVTDCKNLSSLFPFGFVPVLPKLERLIVERNSKLEQVFKLEEKVEVVAEEEMKFDKLKRLSLEELPGLIHFCPKGYHSVFPAMIELKVRDCPKLTTGFFIDSQEFVHCKTKVPQLVEQDAVEESTTVRNAIFNENIDWSRGGGESQLPHIT